MASKNTIAAVAEKGFQNASAYDAYRPSYPKEAVDAFLKALGIADSPDARVVEVASGTGKFTELLAQQSERFLVKAVEPHDGMRNKLVEKDLAGVEVIAGSAEKMPVDDEWGDACIAAQVSRRGQTAYSTYLPFTVTATLMVIGFPLVSNCPLMLTACFHFLY